MNIIKYIYNQFSSGSEHTWNTDQMKVLDQHQLYISKDNSTEKANNKNKSNIYLYF